MELEGSLVLEQPPTRRWVLAVALVVPVAALVGIAAWFVRAYVAPPMVAIPLAPTPTASAPAPQHSGETELGPPHATAAAVEVSRPLPEQIPPSEHTAAMMIASLSLAPPNFSAMPVPPGETEPALASDSPVMTEPARVVVPLPPSRPRANRAATRRVPLPRPRYAVHP